MFFYLCVKDNLEKVNLTLHNKRKSQYSVCHLRKVSNVLAVQRLNLKRSSISTFFFFLRKKKRLIFNWFFILFHSPTWRLLICHKWLTQIHTHRHRDTHTYARTSRGEAFWPAVSTYVTGKTKIAMSFSKVWWWICFSEPFWHVSKVLKFF